MRRFLPSRAAVGPVDAGPPAPALFENHPLWLVPRSAERAKPSRVFRIHLASAVGEVTVCKRLKVEDCVHVAQDQAHFWGLYPCGVCIKQR